jgi:hypothetical protein
MVGVEAVVVKEQETVATDPPGSPERRSLVFNHRLMYTDNGLSAM